MTDQFIDATFADSMNHSVSPTPVKFDEVEVSFSVRNAVMVSLLDAQYDAFNSALQAHGGTLSITKTQWNSYNATLLSSVIGWVNSGQYTVHPLSKIRVPALQAVMFSNIGRVEIPEKGIALKPKFETSTQEDSDSDEGSEVAKLLSLKEMNTISLGLSILEKHGFTFSEGYDKSKEGSVHMMSMQVAENQVLSTDSEAHPFHAVMAATFAVTGLVNLLGEQCYRIKYADTRNIASNIIALAEPRS